MRLCIHLDLHVHLYSLDSYLYVYIHREDKSFDLLDLSCLEAFCGVAEYRKVRDLRGLASGVFYTPL